MNKKNILGENPNKSVGPLPPNPSVECQILKTTSVSHQIGEKSLEEVATLLQYLMCRHRGRALYENDAYSNAWWMLAYPMYYLDKYCIKKWEKDKTTIFSIDSLAPIVHEAWCAIYTFRLQEEVKNNTGLNAKNPFTASRTQDSTKKYEELSKEGKAINKLYVYLYFLLLEAYAKKTYPSMKFNFFTEKE